MHITKSLLQNKKKGKKSVREAEERGKKLMAEKDQKKRRGVKKAPKPKKAPKMTALERALERLANSQKVFAYLEDGWRN